MEVKLTGAVARVLLERAGERGVEVERYLADLLAAELDPEARVQLYLELADKYLKEAEELCARGNLPQAGEKYWGAVASLLNAVAERRGWEHRRHRDYKVTVGRLYEETKDRELLVGMRMAEGLYANFYHNHMGKGEFEVHREAVLKFVERLRALLEGR